MIQGYQTLHGVPEHLQVHEHQWDQLLPSLHQNRFSEAKYFLILIYSSFHHTKINMYFFKHLQVSASVALMGLNRNQVFTKKRRKEEKEVMQHTQVYLDPWWRRIVCHCRTFRIPMTDLSRFSRTSIRVTSVIKLPTRPC